MCRNKEPSSHLLWYLRESGGLSSQLKMQKCENVRDVWPVFVVFKGFVVCIWWGCTQIKKAKTEILDQ